MTTIPFPKLPKQISLEQSRQRNGSKIVVQFKRGKNPLVAHYEGDMAISGLVESFRFSSKPLNEIYIDLLQAFSKEASSALDVADASVAADSVVNLYDRYSTIGRGVHSIAGKNVCTDASRSTTALTLCNNYLITLIHLSRLILEDGRTESDCVVVVDINLAGLETIDGYGIPIPGLDFKPEISRLPRHDLSRGLTYLSSRPVEGVTEDPRLELFTRIVAGQKLPDTRTPNAVVTPIADAFRADPRSISKILVEGVSLLRRHCMEDPANFEAED